MPDVDRVRAAWDANAEHWDRRMGEGNVFALRIVAPAEEELLPLQGGERVLDVACGNGLHARRLARRGARVVALDISPRLVELARARTPSELAIDYRVADATDEREMGALPDELDAIVCHMAIFDMARIDVLFAASFEKLRPGGRLVVSSLHPCFNQPNARLFAEASWDADGVTREVHGVRVTDYAVARETLGRAHFDAPLPHPVYHRPIASVLQVAFDAGFVLDGMREPTMPESDQASRPALEWNGRLAKIPPVIVYRFARGAR